MRRIWFIASALIGLGAAAIAAEQPRDRSNKPTAPPASGTSSSELSRSGGVITPPAGIDPEMKQTPPPSGAKMPVIPPPGTPGGDQSIKPK
jgi:hypothetical protein